jgi:hypothetical protein
MSDKVAIIVVHGVSDQKPHESVHAIANLLLENESDFSAWAQESIRIPVQPMSKPEPVLDQVISQPGPTPGSAPEQEVTSPPDKIEPSGVRKNLNERGENILQELLNKDKKNPSEKRFEKLSHDFSCDFFGYKSEDLKKKSTYDTVIFKTQFGTQGDNKEVHLYEMYWADLSRLGSGFIQFFSEFYQILFHLSLLGQQSIDLAALEHQNGCWKFFSGLMGWAVRIITLPIPIFNLFLLIAAFLSLPGYIPGSIGVSGS